MTFYIYFFRLYQFHKLLQTATLCHFQRRFFFSYKISFQYKIYTSDISRTDDIQRKLEFKNTRKSQELSALDT